MIRFRHVSKRYPNGPVVAQDISLELPGDRCIALLGRNGAGKSSLLRMIAGSIRPDSGQISIAGQVSWPVGFQGSFHPDLSGAQNVRFVARIYGVDTDELLDFAASFSALGRQMHQPIRSYSTGMRARLAFAVSMGIRFDVYLVDEVVSVGDAAFREKSEALLIDRMSDSGAVVVSHSMPMIQRLCTAGAVLEDGQLTYFANLNEAILVHERNLRREPQ
ncbi:MAG: ABC transporter ATP-binding protein [Celeribacter sp.]|jgi:capsular polysaccharide transport system ATP-binding protein